MFGGSDAAEVCSLAMKQIEPLAGLKFKCRDGGTLPGPHQHACAFPTWMCLFKCRALSWLLGKDMR